MIERSRDDYKAKTQALGTSDDTKSPEGEGDTDTEGERDSKSSSPLEVVNDDKVEAHVDNGKAIVVTTASDQAPPSSSSTSLE